MLTSAILCSLFLSGEIRIDPSKVLNRISDDMVGSCIEDVNHEIYGGLYGQRIFGESFEEPGKVVGVEGWKTLGGDWTSSGGIAHCSGGDGPMLLLQGRNIADGSVEANVRVESNQGGSAGLIVRVSQAAIGVDNFNGYEIAFQAKAHTLALGRHRHDYRPLQEVPAPIAPGETHHLRAELAGPKIRVFLDEETTPRIDYVDTDRPLTSGTVAFRPWQVKCRFESLKLNGTPISVTLNQSGCSGMWDPVGLARLSLDHNAYNGSQCQRIDNPTGLRGVGIANRGLNRWGIAVRAHAAMAGSIALRGDVKATIVALQSADGLLTYSSQTLAVTKAWRNVSFRLVSNATDPNARFVVLLNQKGTVFLDQAMLLDDDRFHGLPIRGDIARSMVSEGITFLRYGGTMVNVPGYRWKSMIGAREHRPPYKGTWYPNSTNGFGIFDFLNFCEAAHFRSAFAINIEETEQDAADLADYLTASVKNAWGARRAADGHPAPYHPEYIEIGNEEGIGENHHGELLHYAERFRILEKAIHRRNPNLKLVCAGWWIPGSPDMKPVFDAVDGKAVAWDIHVGSDDAHSGKAVDRELTEVETSFKTWNPKTQLKAVVFEENGGLHNLQRALGHATTVNATRRHGDFVLADCPANCLQPWHQNENGWDQGQIFFTPSQVWGMPPYYSQQMLAEDRLPFRVASQASSGLDVVATRDASGKLVVLSVVNVGAQPIVTTISLTGFPVTNSAAKCLSGDLDAVNSPTDPRRNIPHEIPVALHPSQIEMTFPPHSVTSVRLRSATGVAR